MSIQKTLDNMCIDALPKIKKIISKSGSFEANQMYCKTLHRASSSRIAIDSMTDSQKEEFQSDLIQEFKYKEWMNEA